MEDILMGAEEFDTSRNLPPGITAKQERLSLSSRVVALDEDARTVRHIISTPTLDRMNRMVEPSGWHLKNFRANPIVFANHDYGIDAVIGTGSDVKIETDRLMATTKFDTEGLGAVAFRLVQAGIVRAWSVGWDPIRGHMIGDQEDCARCAAAKARGVHYTAQELIEYSLVTIPANPDAVMGLHTAGLVRTKDVDAWLEAFGKEEREETPVTGNVERGSEFIERLSAASRPAAIAAAARQVSARLKGLRT